MSAWSDVVSGSFRGLREARSRVLLHGASRVGRAPVVVGLPKLINAGSIEIGDDFFFSSSPAPSHMSAAGGRIVIGNGVNISYGAAISARELVTIGDGVSIGPFSFLSIILPPGPKARSKSTGIAFPLEAPMSKPS